MNLTDQQRAAINTRAPRICVAAGAGSGKTFVLVQRIVSLLRDGIDLDGIVAITFTEKAAAEMKARLRKAFRDLADPANLEEMSRWRDYERRLDSARISTIHAFCMRLLKENALHLGLDPDFGLLSEPQSRLLVRDSCRDTLIALMNDESHSMKRLATEWSLPRLREMLTGLAGRLTDLDRVGAAWPTDNPAALAAHWRKQVEGLLLEEARSPCALRQMRSVKAALLSFEGECGESEKCGREIRRRFLIEAVDDFLSMPGSFADLTDLGERVLGYKGKNGVKKAWPSEARYEELTQLQDRAKELFATYAQLPEQDETLEVETAALTDALLQVCKRLSARLESAKAQRNALDFDDLVTRTAAALRQNESLRERAAAGMEHLLMDEFQDTDHAQLGIAEALCSVPRGPQLFVVGDAKQSIYRFRGADVQVFGEAREKSNPVLMLAQNFRSAAGILEFVNDFFQRSQMLDAVEPVFGDLDPHRPAGAAAGVEFLIAESGSESRASAKESREGEAGLIAARITALCSGPAIVWDERSEAYRVPAPGDIAILLRAMSNAHLYTEALHRAGIEYGVVAGAGFYERQEVLDILNLLKAVLDPFDEPALLAVLRGPLCGLRDDTLALLCRNNPLPVALGSGEVSDNIVDADVLQDARKLLHDLRGCRDMPLDDFLQFVLERTHYEALLLGMPNGVQSASNLRKLADLAAEFTASGEPSLATFVAYLDDMRSAAVREGDALLQPQEGGAVTLMTVHKSKGLEFPIVILADASAGLRMGKNSDTPWHRNLGTVLTPPGATDEKRRSLWKEMIRRRNEREELDEHARLLYVGLTRARDHLIISGSATPGKDSWLDLLDSVHQVTRRSDGELLSGDGWQARVIRAVEPPEGRRAQPLSADVDWKALLEKVTQSPPVADSSTSLSVSELLNLIEAGLGDEEAREREPEERFVGKSAALLRGTLAHRLFELWPFGESPAPVAWVLAEAALGPEMRNELNAYLQQLEAKMRGLPVYATLSEAAGMLREQPFLLRVGTRFVRGTIDAFIAPDLVIDYKTGHWKAASHERYVWQLRLYAAAARALTGALPSQGMLVYVDEGRVERVDITDADADAALAFAQRVLESATPA